MCVGVDMRNLLRSLHYWLWYVTQLLTLGVGYLPAAVVSIAEQSVLCVFKRWPDNTHQVC